MAFPRPAVRVWSYWRSERRTFRQGFVALLLSTAAAFVAGLVLGSIHDTLVALPGLIILIPAAVGMRGTIFGAIGARLGTATHAGLFEVTAARTGVLYRNVWVGLVTTLISSLYLAILATGLANVFGLPSISVWSMITISVVGGLLGSVLIMALTIGFAVLSYRKGYDLDTVGTPMVTAVGDMISIPCLFLATFLIRSDAVNAVIAGLSVAGGVTALVMAFRTTLPGVRRILLEMVGVVLLTPLLDLLAGTVVQARLAEFVALPILLVLIPPFVSQAGALGGILSSRLSSKLQLGLITPRGLPESPALLDGSLVMGFGVVVFTLIGVTAVAIGAVTGLAGPPAATLLGGTLLAGVVATVITIFIGYYLAIVSSRFGLDPDNQGVPIITSAMDLAGVGCVLFAMGLLGVGHG